ETCFRTEVVKHPRTGRVLAYVPAQLAADELSPKEEALLALCRDNKALGRRVLAYTTYTGTRDTTTRMKAHLEREGFKVAVLRASVEAARREEWLLDQVDRGVEVVITNPELVKTGLDMLEFPTICFMNTGYNVFTLQQAARRSWRIGQRQDVEVHFLGYAGTTQINCLQLMGKKVAVSQSTSGDVPESGLDVLNQDDEALEVALAKQLLAA
ncbi:MAG: helicase-related protein, partial [Lysobacterales bacterium]